MTTGHVILTGLRANSDLHLGNYLGGMLPMVKLQKELGPNDQLFMFVPDLHSLTTPIDHGKLYANTIDNMRTFIAAGVDPQNSQTTLYRQSYISSHSEFAWILNCFTYFGEASRMTEFKDKSERLGHKAVTVGLFDYPVLMAADILLYRADYVPLGDDQKQHMELARTLAERVNAKFGDILTVPKSWDEQLKFSGRDQSLRIRSLKSPEQKMSKSVSDPSGTITLQDKPVDAAKKIMGATTDSVGAINFDYEKQPGISNLLTIASQLEGKPIETVTDEWKGQIQYGPLKEHVAKLVTDFLTDFQTRFSAVEENEVVKVLEAGETKANELARETLKHVQKAVGLRQA